MGLVTILRTKDDVQLFLGIGRAHLVLSMAPVLPSRVLLRGTGALAAQLAPVLTASMPQRECRPGLSRQRHKKCGTTARVDDEAGNSTKRDLGSCKKKEFSLSNCFDDHHHSCRE